MEEYVGVVKLLALNFLPTGWLPCDGRLLPILDENVPLCGAIGTTFGGDGETNFALPNLAPVMTTDGIPMHYYICVRGLFPLRS
jgi:microcystin-dependent protein